jgi:hypothetical protein
MRATTMEKTYSLRYDTTDPSNPGWYAEYYNAEGDVIDDSVKIWHPDMPTDPEAREEAEEIAAEYAAGLAVRETNNETRIYSNRGRG